MVVQGSLTIGDPGGTLAILKGEDELWATVEGQEKRMSSTSADGLYRAVFDADDDAADVVVSFRRGPDDDGAPNSNVRLPPAFSVELEGLSRGAQWPRGTPLVLKWTPPGGSSSVGYHVQGSCVWPVSSRTSDDGHHVLTDDDIRLRDPLYEGASCDVIIELSRSTLGSVDPAFQEGGRFSGSQMRRINFTSTPGPDETLGGSASGGSGGGSDDGSGGGSGDGSGNSGSENSGGAGGAGSAGR